LCYLFAWRDLRRRANADSVCCYKLEITLLPNSNHIRDGTGCRRTIEDLAASRKHGFSLERAVFLTVLHRLFSGGSDRAADRWREDYAINGVEGLDLHHLYRAMAWLGEELAEDQQYGATPFAPRC
jgi:hypothetical protein